MLLTTNKRRIHGDGDKNTPLSAPARFSMEVFAEKAIFAHTSLGTRLALSVPENITSGDLKRKLMCEHSSCFPAFGKIVVHSLMVKQKSFSYHIPDSMPVKNACRGSRDAWFLQIVASRLPDMSMQQTVVSSSINRQYSSYPGETINPNSNKIPTSTNLMSPSNSACCKLQHQFSSTEPVMDHKGEPFISDMPRSSTFNIVDLTISSFPTTNMGNQEGKTATDHLKCDEANVGVSSSSSFSQKGVKRMKLGHRIQGNAIGKEASDTRKTCEAGLDSGKEVIRCNALIDEAQYEIQTEKVCPLEFPLERRQNMRSLSKEETCGVNFSEKISVTGLILRYFSDNEVNSNSILKKNGRETENTAPLLNNFPRVQESHLTGEIGFSTNIQNSADKKGSNDAESDLEAACSFNINTSETNQFCSLNNKKTKSIQNNGTYSDGKRRRKATLSSVKKNTTGYTSHHHPDNVSSCGNKPPKSTSQTDGKCIHATPHITPSPFNKHNRAFNSYADRCEVGKHLVHAANNICSSVSAKKSAKSRCISRCRNMSATDSIVIVKRFSFDTSDADD